MQLFESVILYNSCMIFLADNSKIIRLFGLLTGLTLNFSL